MANVQIAAPPIGADVQVVHDALDVISPDHNHRLIRLVVSRARESISGDELEIASEATLQLYCQAVVTRVGRTLEQTYSRKAGNRTRCRKA